MNQNKFKSLSIIIPNYNGEKLIPVFLPSVIKAAKKYPGACELIFVDDCSTDRSVHILNNYIGNFEKFKLVEAKKNGGFSKTCNLGIQNSSNEILFFLNSDVALNEEFFDFFSHNFEDPEVFAVTVCGMKYLTDQQIDGIKANFWRNGFLRVTKNIFNESINKKNSSQALLSFNVQGSYFFADAKKIKVLGGFDELFSPYIYEETDLAYRALKRGWKIIYEPKCVAYHNVGSSLKSVADKLHLKKVSSRNRLIFIWKNVHSKKLIINHLVFLLLSLITLDFVMWSATINALKVFKEIMHKRKVEVKKSIVSDEGLLNFYREYFARF